MTNLFSLGARAFKRTTYRRLLTGIDFMFQPRPDSGRKFRILGVEGSES